MKLFIVELAKTCPNREKQELVGSKETGKRNEVN